MGSYIRQLIIDGLAHLVIVLVVVLALLLALLNEDQKVDEAADDFDANVNDGEVPRPTLETVVNDLYVGW